MRDACPRSRLHIHHLPCRLAQVMVHDGGVASLLSAAAKERKSAGAKAVARNRLQEADQRGEKETQRGPARSASTCRQLSRVRAARLLQIRARASVSRVRSESRPPPHPAWRRRHARIRPRGAARPAAPLSTVIFCRPPGSCTWPLTRSRCMRVCGILVCRRRWRRRRPWTTG